MKMHTEELLANNYLLKNKFLRRRTIFTLPEGSVIKEENEGNMEISGSQLPNNLATETLTEGQSSRGAQNNPEQLGNINNREQKSSINRDYKHFSQFPVSFNKRGAMEGRGSYIRPITVTNEIKLARSFSVQMDKGFWDKRDEVFKRAPENLSGNNNELIMNQMASSRRKSMGQCHPFQPERRRMSVHSMARLNVDKTPSRRASVHRMSFHTDNITVMNRRPSIVQQKPTILDFGNKVKGQNKDPVYNRKLHRTMSDSKLLMSHTSINRGHPRKLTSSVSTIETKSESPDKCKDYDPLLRFRRAAKTVMVLVKAVSSRQEKLRAEEKQLSLATYQDEILNSRRSNYGKDLSFDPMEFKARKQVTLSNEAKTILSMSPQERTEEQIHVALLSLQNALDAFCEFPIKMQTSLVRRGWYEHFESKRIIIRQGHKADNFYMIISGKALVTILKTDSLTGESKATTAAVLGKGQSFGELAIMHGATRSATVTCQTDVELLALNRDDFVDIFMHVEKNLEPEHIRFLRTVDIFKAWPINKLPWNDTSICLFMYFRRGTLMCKDSNNSEWIYVIKTGSCKVLKCLSSTKPDIPGLSEASYEDLAAANSTTIRPPTRPIAQISRSSEGSLLALYSPKQQNSYRYRPGFLPPIKGVKEKNSDDDDILERHKQKLDDIYKELQYMRMRTGKHEEQRKAAQGGKPIFVQIQKLGPKGTLGLEPIAFEMMDHYTSVSLVSEGVEAVLINKKFFQQYLTEDYQRHLRTTLQPYPSDDSLQQQLQDETNWSAFKTITVNNHVHFNKFAQETLSL